MFADDTDSLRKKLLEVPGIGPETADSILLYAGNKPSFVVDAYTRRILFRHNLIPEEADYEEVRNFLWTISLKTCNYLMNTTLSL